MFRVRDFLSDSVAVLFLILSVLFFSNTTHYSQEVENNHSLHVSNLIRYVKNDVASLYSGKSESTKVISTFDYSTKIIVLSTENTKNDDWVNVIYPSTGFLKKDELFTEKEFEDFVFSESKADSTDIFALSRLSVMKFGGKKLNGYETLSLSSTTKSQNKNIIEEIIITPNIEWFADSSIYIWWSDVFDKNNSGYSTFSNLNIRINQNHRSKELLKAVVFAREEKEENYQHYFATKEFEVPNKESDKTITITIGSREKKLMKGVYNFKVEIYERNSKALFAVLDQRFNALQKRKFESLDYAEEDIEINETKEQKEVVVKNTQRLDNAEIEPPEHQLTMLGHYAVFTRPIEEVFENNKYAYGASLDYTKSNWSFGGGFNWNKMEEAINVDSTLIKTETFALYGDFYLLRFIKDKFNFELVENLCFSFQLGATYWKTEFQKIKYNGIKENYHTKMNNEGYGVLLGSKITYSFYNIVFGVQYQLFHSGLAEFSKTIEYTTFEGNKVNVIDKYKLYPGYQQIQLILGYRLEL